MCLRERYFKENRMRHLFHSTLLCLILIAPPICSAIDEEAGFVSLFDGRSLRHWVQVHQNGASYLVQDGKIVCPACPADNTLFTDKEFSNFVFRFEFKMEPRGDNGIAIRTALEGDPAYKAMEIQVLDDAHPAYADVAPNWRHGSVWDVIAARTGFLKPAGEWNDEEITADGCHIKVRLNGTTILDADLDSVKDPAVLKKHPGLFTFRNFMQLSY
jgi:hypothetical protein